VRGQGRRGRGRRVRGEEEERAGHFLTTTQHMPTLFYFFHAGSSECYFFLETLLE